MGKGKEEKVTEKIKENKKSNKTITIRWEKKKSTQDFNQQKKLGSKCSNQQQIIGCAEFVFFLLIS